MGLVYKSIIGIFAFGAMLFVLWHLWDGDSYFSMYKDYSNEVNVLNLILGIYMLIIFGYHFLLFSGIMPLPAPLINYVLRVPIAFSLCFLISGISLSFRGGTVFYSLICHAGGSLYTSIFLYYFVGYMTEIEDLTMMNFFKVFAPYFVGLGIAAYFSFMLKKKEQDA